MYNMYNVWLCFAVFCFLLLYNMDGCSLTITLCLCVVSCVFLYLLYLMYLLFLLYWLCLIYLLCCAVYCYLTLYYMDGIVNM